MGGGEGRRGGRSGLSATPATRPAQQDTSSGTYIIIPNN